MAIDPKRFDELKRQIALAPIDTGLKQQYLTSLDYTINSSLSDQKKLYKIQVVVDALRAALEARKYNQWSTILLDTFTATIKDIGVEVEQIGKVALGLKDLILNKWVLIIAGLIALGLIVWINYGSSIRAGRLIK